MSVYLDTGRNRFGRMVMCHMIADTPDELHRMARLIGMIPLWYQGPDKASFPHYDVSASRRACAVRHGAIEVERKALVTVMRRVRETEDYPAAWAKAPCDHARAYLLPGGVEMQCPECGVKAGPVAPALARMLAEVR